MKDDLTAAVIIILYGIGSILTDGETDLFFIGLFVFIIMVDVRRIHDKKNP